MVTKLGRSFAAPSNGGTAPGPRSDASRQELRGRAQPRERASQAWVQAPATQATEARRDTGPHQHLFAPGVSGWEEKGCVAELPRLRPHPFAPTHLCGPRRQGGRPGGTAAGQVRQRNVAAIHRNSEGIRGGIPNRSKGPDAICGGARCQPVCGRAVFVFFTVMRTTVKEYVVFSLLCWK